MPKFPMLVLSGVLITTQFGAVACSSDDGADGGTDGGADGGGLNPEGGLTLPDSSTPGSADGDEGKLCSEDAECQDGLRCTGNSFPGVSGLVETCNRPCTEDSDCGTDACLSTSGREEDMHCVALVREEFAVCGLGVASVCAGRTCLYLGDLTVGTCVTLCTLDDPDGGVDDAGAPGAAPECTDEQVCLGGVLSSEAEGLCSEEVDRGEECGTELLPGLAVNLGLHCASGDVCELSDPADESSTTRCYQDCRDVSVKCDSGACTSVGSDRAYCL